MTEAVQAGTIIGRQRHLATVRGWVADLTNGRGRPALIEGEPGIGKSTLVTAAAEDAAAAGCLVLRGSCDELSQAFPLLPLLDAFDNGREASQGRAKIMDILRSDSLGNQVDLVAAATERLLGLVAELSAPGPVMVVVDDLQWADQATVNAWGRLARATRTCRLLLVGTVRPIPRRQDLSALRRTVEPAARIRLSSLSDEDSLELVSRAVGGPVGPRLRGLVAAAAGNPLYLTELVDALVRGRALSEEGGCFELTAAHWPRSLAAAIADRLEFLSPPVREVLQAAALLGADFSVSELSVVSGRRVNELLPAIEEAIATGVLRDDLMQLRFRHPLIRAALYEAMPAAVRAAWHWDAGRALAEQGASAERVARQVLPALDEYADDGAEGEPAAGAPQAGVPQAVDDWLVRWLTDAGQQLVGQAPHAAAPLLRWAVAALRPGVAPHDLLSCRLADALFRTGDVAGAEQVATAALGHVTRPDMLVDLHWTLTNCRSMEGRSEESVAALRRALDVPGLGARHRARLLALTARVQRGLGRVETAEQVASAALDEATTADDKWAMGWSLGVLTMARAMRGEAAEALPLFDRALAVAEGHPGLTDLRLVLQINQAMALGDVDRYDDAIAAADQVRVLSDHAGNALRRTQAQSVLGELFFDVGRWDDALHQVDPEPDVCKHPLVECCDHGIAATIRLHRGNASASRDLSRADKYAKRIGDQVVGSYALAKSLAREQAGELEQALAVLTTGLPETGDDLESAVDLFADAVRLGITLGDWDTVHTVVECAEAAGRGSSVPHREAVALHCRGLVDNDPATLLRAADRYAAAGRLLPRAQVLEAAGVALAEADQVPAARGYFSDAFELYTTLGAGWDLARTQARFRTYGIRRGPRTQHRRAQQGWDSLTPTELTVVRLVARGMTNPQIAGELFLSRRTVQTHVSHVLAKLQLNSRTDIAREASRREGLAR